MGKTLVSVVTVLMMLITAGLQNKAGAEDIYGCYKKKHGQFRIVPSEGRCLKSERPITITQGAMNVLGDYCLQLSNEGGAGTTFLKLKLTGIDEASLAMNGLSQNGLSEAGAVHGNAVMAGEQMLITLNSSRMSDLGTNSSTISMVLDSITFGGMYREMTQDYNLSLGSFEPSYHISGTVTAVTCPQ